MLIENFYGGFDTFFLILISLIGISLAIYVIIYKNPVVSVLFLIGLFFSIALYLIIIGLEFIGLSYLLVYVGAISILFLFILMLINIRISELISDTKNSVLLLILIVLLFNIIFINIIPSEYINLYSTYTNLIYIYASESWEGIMAAVNNISSLGYTMYTNLSIFILLVCNILLLAMVGAIIITIKPKDFYPNIFTNTQTNLLQQNNFILVPSIFMSALGINKISIKLKIKLWMRTFNTNNNENITSVPKTIDMSGIKNTMFPEGLPENPIKSLYASDFLNSLNELAHIDFSPFTHTTPNHLPILIIITKFFFVRIWCNYFTCVCCYSIAFYTKN